jgi:rubrerythrin
LRRRDAVLGGLTAAATIAAGPRALARQSSPPALPEGDLEIVERALKLEERLAASYAMAARGELLEEEVREAAELFAAQEREHADALRAALVDLGGAVPELPATSRIDDLGEIGSQRALLELLAGLEREAIAFYDEAATRLTAPDLLKTGAQIVGSEAQHLAVLRQQLGQEPVPVVFGAGAPDEPERSSPEDG